MGCQFSAMSLTSMNTVNNDHSEIDKNHFVSTGILGEGGFGRVVAAMSVKNGNWYAVKEINKFELVKHKCGVSMIFGELNAMKKLDNNPFIINLQLAFQDRHFCFLVLDLKTGGDLRYFLRKRYLFDERDCAFYVACLSSALDYIHSKNIIHRDVKPENIIFDERGYPYLTDFGVAHVQSDPWDKTLTCNLASGTKQYLAPEVFTKSHVHGPEVDFWSLGVVIYEVLFARRPFEKHCPINFIQYLEKALSAKRKYLKEMKMRELSQSSDMTAPIMLSSLSRISGDTNRQNSYSSLSSPPKEQCDASLGPKATKLPSFSSPAKTAQSTDCSTWEKDSAAMYCSSAGNSPNITQDFNKRVGQQGSAGSTFQDVSLSTDGCQKLSADTTDTSNSPNKKSKERFLPELKQSPVLSNIPSKSLFKRNPVIHPSGAMNEGGVAFENSSDNSFLGSNSGDSNESAEAHVRAIPGDHWLVDEGDLPHSLVVSIPYTNPWLGILSNECVELLLGLFEVRPSHRYGCRNINKIRYSRWLDQYKLSDWEELGTKKYSPRFQPGKRFVKDTLSRIDDITQARLLGSFTEDADGNLNEESIPIISIEQEEMFKEFFYVAQSYQLSETTEMKGLSKPLDPSSSGKKKIINKPNNFHYREKLSL